MLRYYDLFTGFLVVVGLGSLLIGGVSVWSVMSAYIAERSGLIAVLRSLGASRLRVLVHFLVQVLALGLIGVAIGVAIGVTIGLVVLPAIGDAIGIPLVRAIDLPAILIAGSVGIITAFAFSYLPLVQAQMVSPASLFRARGLGAPPIHWRQLLSPALLPLIVAAGLFAWLAVILAGDTMLVLAFGGACLAAALVLRLGSALVLALLRRLPQPGWRPLRQALRSIAGSSSDSAAVVTAVGLAVVILVAVQVLAVNLRNEFLGASVFDAPSFVATDLFPDEVDLVRSFVDGEAGIVSVTTTPMVRGAVSAVNGTPVDQIGASGPEAAFLLSGDIPLTYRAEMPSSSRLVDGAWWPSDYSGEPQVSLHQNLRQGLGIGVGDTVTFTIFGEEIVARVANFRDYAWQGGIDFLVSFAPGTLDFYPATLLAAVTAAPGREEDAERFLAAQLPDVKFIAIGATLQRITEALGQLSLAVAAVGGLAVLNGLLILVGSLASGRRQREADAVITKVLGAQRGEILLAAILQFLLLAAFAALLAAPVGVATAWAISAILLNVAFAIDLGGIGLVASAWSQ